MRSTAFSKTARYVLPLVFIPVSFIYGDALTGLSAEISSSGDVPSIDVNCDGTDASAYISQGDRYDGSLVTGRSACVNGVAHFAGFNLNDLLSNRVDPQWANYFHLPVRYVVKNTTGLYTPVDDYSVPINLCGAFDNYHCASAYDPADNEWPTLGAGPAFTTVPYSGLWSNVTNGDGSANVATSTATTTSTGNDNVLFLPGLEASRLYVQKQNCSINCEDQLWEPNTDSDGQELFLDTSGASMTPNVYTRDIIKSTNLLPIFGQNIYKSFSDMMDGLVAAGTIAAWQPYAYDWRQSVQDIVDNGTPYQLGSSTIPVSLIGTLQTLVKTSKSGKVTIVAHSNGGLIAKYLLKKLEEDKAAGTNDLIDHIGRVILVASPQLGTPTALSGLLHGYDQDINPVWVYSFLTKLTSRELGQNMPSAYGLLPSATYFAHVSNPVVGFTPNSSDPYMTKDVSLYGAAISTYDAEKSFLLGGDARNTPLPDDILKPIRGNAALMNTAENLHAAIDMLTLPASIKVIQIAGWGLDTVVGFTYSDTGVCSSSTENGCTGQYLLDETPIFTDDGDKTVVTPSALAMGGEKWWVNLYQYNNDKPPLSIGNQHKNIFEVSPILNLISDVISNQMIIPSIYLSTTTPIDTTNHLHLSVHSPVTLGAYDSAGDFTGKVCDTSSTCVIEENIPNSSYYEFGEGKYLNVPQGGAQSVVLAGTDTGTFTFDYQTVMPDGSATTTSFQDIPVTPTMDATITPTINGAPTLVIDVNGDGKTDLNISANSVFDPVAYLQVMEATINTLDLPPAKIKAFDARVESIIKSIQKGKVNKAKLKAENFAKVLEHRLAKPDPKKPRPKQLSKSDAQELLDLLNGLLDNLN